MQSFPLFFRTTGARVTIVGGGEQAAQKARLILKTDAEITLVADRLDPELAALVQTGRATHQTELSTEVFDAAFAFIATGCPGLDAAAHGLAKAARCPVNVVDRPSLCDVTTPAIVDRAPIVVAIGSEGTAPVLTRDIKTRLEAMLPQNLGGLAALAGRLRPAVTRAIPRAGRRAFWAWVFKGAPGRDWTRGQERAAATAIKAAMAAGQAPSAQAGHVSLVETPAARDLLTLRAVERLQEADVIFYDGPEAEPLLELARRDAERVSLCPPPGTAPWPSDRITALTVTAARQGQQVVRLIAADEAALAALNQSGISADLVPSVHYEKPHVTDRATAAQS